MTIVIGVDPASVRLAAIVTPLLKATSVTAWSSALPKDQYDRCSAAYDWIQEVIENSSVAGQDMFVFLEQPFVWGSGTSTIVLAQISGSVIAGARKSGVQVVMVNVSTWKKTIVGNGRAKKPEVMQWAQKYWPSLYELADGNQDVVDAGCINRYGTHVLNMRENIGNRRRVIRTKKK